MSLPAEENSTQSEAATRRLSSDALRRSAMENGTIRSESMNQTSAVEDAATLVASEEKAKTNGRTIGMILLSVVVVLVVGFIFHSPQTNPTSFQAALHETDRALVSNDGACSEDSDCNSNLCIAGTCKKTFILANPRTGKGLGMTGVCEQDVQTHAWDYDPSFGGQTYFEHEGRVHPAKCKLLLALEVSSANGPWCNSAGNIILSEPNDNENQKLKIDCSGMLVSYGTTDIDGQVCQSVVSIAGQSHSNGAKIVLSPKDRTIMDYQVFLVGSEVGSTCSQDLNCASTLCHDGVCAN
mmetsp:Transcript_18370/g.27995  ORF Transcript_18370/g.27995 Transcript_18370/m.27995 type:complete len:296 (-) Transcript_18370:89-976(-)